MSTSTSGSDYFDETIRPNVLRSSARHPSRQGTDCFSHMLLAVTDTNPDATMLGVDGVGAHDHVLRAAMLGRQARMRRASAFLFFVLKSCSGVSTHKMVRRSGQRHRLEEENMATFRCRCCSPSEFRSRRGSVSVVTAFLDDVFFGGGAWEDEALVRFSLGRVAEARNRKGTVPEYVAIGSPEVLQTDGMKGFGMLLEDAQFWAAHTQEPLEEEQRLWDTIPSVLVSQCAWKTVVHGANPRANHLSGCPRRTFAGLEHRQGALVGDPLDGRIEGRRAVDHTPSARTGGFGLRSAELCRCFVLGGQTFCR